MIAAGTRLGPYVIAAPIGSGGMGEVYKAHDTRLERTVAIKVLSPHLTASTAARERFQREARAVAALQHPNICTVHDVGQTETGQHFIVMELLEGETLQQRLVRGPLDVEQLMEFGIALADALDTAHGRSLIHRDIKPANVFLTSRGPKLLDFGLAKSVASAAAASIQPTSSAGMLTDPGSAVGTVAYMSPEQLRGEVLDARTDLFSVGLVLYEMATATRAFTGPTTAVISAAILDRPPASPRAIRPDLPPILDEVILKALEKDRDIRCQTASELRADLKRAKRDLDRVDHSRPVDIGTGSSRRETATALAGPTPPPAPSSDSQILAALVKRHGAMVGIAALGLVAVLAGGIYTVSMRSVEPASETSNASLDRLEVAQLTTSGNAERPAISPDGRYVAYVQRGTSGDSLWIRQTATTSNVQIVPPESDVRLQGVTVTPDGSFVDFLRTELGRFPSLYRVPFLGGVPKRMIDNVSTSPDWSPDAKRLAFVRTDQANGIDSLIVTGQDGTGERVLVTRRRPAVVYNGTRAGSPTVRPAWSPDGKTIAVYGAVTGGSENGTLQQMIFVDVATGGERVVALPAMAGDPQGLAWLDNEWLLANHSPQAGAPEQLWRLSSRDARVSRLTNDLNAYFGLSVSADRSMIVTMRADTRASIWVGDGAAGNGMEVIAPAPFSARATLAKVAWAGEHLVYGSTVAGRARVSLLRSGRGTPEEVVLDALEARGAPDGTIVYSSTDAAREGLWKAYADGRPAERLVSGNVRNPVMAPNGQFVVFLSTRRGPLSPWIVSIGGGEPAQVATTFAGEGSLAVSPDSRAILFQSAGNTILCDLPACTSRRTLPPRLVGVRRWNPDGRALAYIDQAQTNVWLQPLDGSPASQLTHFTDGRLIADYAWSHDGQRLAISRVEARNDIVLFRGLQ